MADDTNAEIASRVGWDNALRRLRRDGFSPIDTVKITRAVLGVELDEAKRIVHASEAWADAREGFDELHDVAEEAANLL